MAIDTVPTDRGAGLAVTASVLLTAAAVAVLLARDSALGLHANSDVIAAAVAAAATAAGVFAILRSPPRWSRLWWPAGITLVAALVAALALTFRFALTQQWTAQVEIAGEPREVRLYAPRGEGPYPGVVLVGRPGSAEAGFLGRFLAERGLVVLHSPTVPADDMQAQAAQAAVELTWLTGQGRVDARRSGFYGTGQVAGLAAAVAPEAHFVVTVLEPGTARPAIWSEVDIAILALVGGKVDADSPSAEGLVDELIDVVAPETLMQLEWLIFDDSDRRLRESRAFGWHGLPRGYPLAMAIWIHGLADEPDSGTMPMPWMPSPEEET